MRQARGSASLERCEAAVFLLLWSQKPNLARFQSFAGAGLSKKCALSAFLIIESMAPLMLKAARTCHDETLCYWLSNL